MKKFLTKSFLSLFILLLGGHSLFYAPAYLGRIHTSSMELSETFERAGPDTGKSPAVIKHASSDKEKMIQAIDASEVEEQERQLISFRKKSGHTDYFPALFCALTFRIVSSGIKPISPFCKHFAYRSSYRPHLIYQVFRI